MPSLRVWGFRTEAQPSACRSSSSNVAPCAADICQLSLASNAATVSTRVHSGGGGCCCDGGAGCCCCCCEGAGEPMVSKRDAREDTAARGGGGGGGGGCCSGWCGRGAWCGCGETRLKGGWALLRLPWLMESGLAFCILAAVSRSFGWMKLR